MPSSLPLGGRAAQANLPPQFDQCHPELDLGHHLVRQVYELLERLMLGADPWDATHEHIRVATRVSTFCTPVLVLWVDPPLPEPTQIAGVWIVPGPALVAWLLGRPAPISRVEADRIWPAVCC